MFQKDLTENKCLYNLKANLGI